MPRECDEDGYDQRRLDIWNEEGGFIPPDCDEAAGEPGSAEQRTSVFG
jgi:hypothetical protein